MIVMEEKLVRVKTMVTTYAAKGGDARTIIEQSGLSLSDVAEYVSDLAKKNKLDWAQADRFMEGVHDAYGGLENKECLKALACYDAKMDGVREKQEHLKRYNFDIDVFVRRNPEPTKEEFLKQSGIEEEKGNVKDAADLAFHGKDFDRAASIYRKIAEDELMPLAERAKVAEHGAFYFSLEPATGEISTNFYSLAGKLFERAAKTGESVPGDRSPAVVRNVLSALTGVDYDMSHLLGSAARCAENAGDFSRAAWLNSRTDLSERVVEINPTAIGEMKEPS